MAASQCAAGPCLPRSSVEAQSERKVGAGRSLDVAVREGCGEVAVDWVVEVCSDPAAASADPVEAHLMDGRCAQQWARRALTSCQARLLQVPVWPPLLPPLLLLLPHTVSLCSPVASQQVLEASNS